MCKLVKYWQTRPGSQMLALTQPQSGSTRVLIDRNPSKVFHTSKAASSYIPYVWKSGMWAQSIPCCLMSHILLLEWNISILQLLLQSQINFKQILKFNFIAIKIMMKCKVTKLWLKKLWKTSQILCANNLYFCRPIHTIL